MPSKQAHIVGPKAILRRLQARIDMRAGYPKPAFRFNPLTDAFDMPAPDVPPTAHLVDVVDHSDGLRSALEVDPLALPHLVAIRAAIRARVQAGTATQDESDIDGLPGAAALDATWDTPTPP
jgi:hypothetical protein